VLVSENPCSDIMIFSIATDCKRLGIPKSKNLVNTYPILVIKVPAG
jgi:hypothetical protein